MGHDPLACRRCGRTWVEFRPKRRVCRDCEREESRKRVFELIRGITHEERDKLLEAQDNKCAACGAEEPGSTKGWHVDHCHTTDKIRGVLCASCNIAIGQAGDSPERLRQMATYLEEQRWNLP